MKQNRWMAIWLAVALLTGASIQGEEVGRAGAAGAFLRMGLGARAMAMGGGNPALLDGGNSAYYNPAGVAFIDRYYATGSLNSMALDRSQYYVGFAMSFEQKKTSNIGMQNRTRAGFSVGWFSSGVGNIDARDTNGNDIGTLSTQEHAFYFTFALCPTEKVAIGLSAKVLHHRIPDLTITDKAVTAIGLGFDMGVMARPLERLTLGLTVSDLRSRYTWDTEDLYEKTTQKTDNFPVVLRLGAGYECLPGFLAVAGMEKIENRPATMNAGVEAFVFNMFFGRAGLRRGDMTLGAGFRTAIGKYAVQIDYAFVPDPVAPSAGHVFTWNVLF